MAQQQSVSEFLQTPAIREQLLQQLERISTADLGISYTPNAEVGGALQFGTKSPEQRIR